MTTSSDDGFEQRRERLFAGLAELGRVAVAFSGGVDSSVLLHASFRALGPQAVGLIADSPSLPRRELEEARRVAAAIGAPLVELRTDEGADPRYRANAGERCYFCKQALFRAMAEWARGQGGTTLAFGEIVDDLRDDRPGARAAAQARVRAPLREAGMTKSDVRRYAREAGLAVADKPASACLASRIPLGTVVTPERLARVESAEDALHDLGLRQLRVRNHGPHARVEVGAEEIAGARRREAAIERALAALGFESFELGVYRPPVQEDEASSRTPPITVGPPPGGADAVPNREAIGATVARLAETETDGLGGRAGFPDEP